LVEPEWRRAAPGQPHYLHGYVWCDGMIAGELAHSCRHGPGPHRIKVCITKIDNKKNWREIERVAPPRPLD
jgi:hypothetical protein